MLEDPNSYSDSKTKEIKSPVEKFEVISSSLLLEQYGGDRIRNSVDNLGIKEELELINVKYRSILSTQDERILFRPILAYKIKPKNILGIFQAKWRYLMFTNKRLYTFDPATYEAGNIIDQDRLIVNRIDIDFLSHMIFFPHFLFDSLEVFDVSKLRTEYSEMRRNALKEDLLQKKCQLILGFKQNLYGRFNFNESDIALETNMFVVLQIIHACQLVNLEEFAEFNKESLIDRKINQGQRGTRTTQQTASNRNMKNSLSLNAALQQTSKHPRNQIGEQEIKDGFTDDGKVDLISNQRLSIMKKRTLQKLEKINYFPVFIVKNQKYNKNLDNNGSLGRSNDRTSFQSPRGDNQSQSRFIRSLTRIGQTLDRVFSRGPTIPVYKLKQFYRSKNSQAEYSIGQIPEVLKRVDTKYFCELFWALERESYPIFIQNEIQEIERLILLEQDEELKIQDYRSQEKAGNDRKFVNSQKKILGKQSSGSESLSYPFQYISGAQPEPSDIDRKSWRTTEMGQINKDQNPCMMMDKNQIDFQKSALTDLKHQYYVNDKQNNLLNSSNKCQFNSPQTRKSHNNLQQVTKQKFTVPNFMLEEIRGFKGHIVPTPQLKKEFEHQKFKLYKPFILQNQVQLEFRSGDFIFLAIRISRVLNNAKEQSVQDLVHSKAKVFDQDLADVFPNYSQPKVLLREFVGKDPNSNTDRDEQVQYRMYFGFLIPRFRKTLPVDSNNLSIIGFKHGLMLLYQFIQFMVNIHKKEHNFGYLDFSNIYFAENKDAQKKLAQRKLTLNRKQSDKDGAENIKGLISQQDGQSGNGSNNYRNGFNNQQKSDSKFKNESQTQLFTVDLIFIDKQLQNLAIEENNELLNQGYLNGCISQTTLNEQKLYQQNQIDEDYFELSAFTQSVEIQTAGERSKSPPHSIVPVNPITEIRSEMIKNQQKIDQILKNITVSPNYTEIESLKIFIDTILQYCHRIQSTKQNKNNNELNQQKNEERSKSKQKSGSLTKNEQVKDTKEQEESYEFLRKKDDQMRLNLLLDFLSIFNTHLVKDVIPNSVSPRGKNQNQKKINERTQSLNSFVSLGSEKPQSIRNFEQKIFENQLIEAMNLCLKYIDIYEDKEFWQNSLAQYIEDISAFNQSQLQSNIYQASSLHIQSVAIPEGKISPLDVYERINTQIKNKKINDQNRKQIQIQQSDDNQVPNPNHSFISFTNYSASQPGLDNPAMSQANPHCQSQSLIKKNIENNEKKNVTIVNKKKVIGQDRVKAHENILEDMLNMTQNFDNLYSENGQTERSSTIKSFSSQIEAIEKGKFTGESSNKKKIFQEVNNKNMTDYKSRQEQKAYPMNFKRRLEVQEQIEKDQIKQNQKNDKNLRLGDLIEDDEMYFEQQQSDDQNDISNRKGNQLSLGRSNNTVRVKQREKKLQLPQQIGQVSCREGIESIVSGSGTQGEKGDMSYVNFMLSTGKKQNFTKFGTISGIGIGAQQYKDNLKSQAQIKVQLANEKFQKQIQEQKNKQQFQNEQKQNYGEQNKIKRGGHVSQQKYAQQSIVNEIKTKIKDEELPESEDDEEENEQVYELPKSPRLKPNQQKKGHVNLVPQIDRKSRISSESGNNQSNLTSQLSNNRQESPLSSRLSKDRNQQSQISKSSKGSIRINSPPPNDRNPSSKLQSVHQGKIGELQKRTSSKLSKEKSKVSQGSSQFSDKGPVKSNEMLMIKHLHENTESKQSTPQFNEPYQERANYRR